MATKWLGNPRQRRMSHVLVVVIAPVSDRVARVAAVAQRSSHGEVINASRKGTWEVRWARMGQRGLLEQDGREGDEEPPLILRKGTRGGGSLWTEESAARLQNLA
jgi:hypothetical protein